MLDWAHKLTLQSVAGGDAEDSPALRTLVASGLVEQRPDGTYAVTPAGQVALEEDERGFAATFCEVTWGSVGGSFLALAILFAIVNSLRGDALLTEMQVASLLIVGVLMSLALAYVKRAAR